MKNLLYVYKSMGIIVQNEWRSRAIFVTIMITLISLFASRAFLSVSIILFLSLTLLHTRIISQGKVFFRSPVLLGMSFLFLIPFISGLWSADVQEWLDLSRTKLPFLLLPLAFAGDWNLSERQWLLIAWVFLLMVTAGCSWSLWEYLQDTQAINESYLRAKTIPTPLKDDHVRYSWLVSTAVLLAVLLIYLIKNKKERIILTVLTLYFVIYLHVLSARTGLAMVYFFFACLAVYLVTQKIRRLAIFLVALLLVSAASWWIFPTLQNRIKYTIYDLSFIKKEGTVPGTSDANRLISLEAGWQLLKGHPWGVGGGDVRHEIENWYKIHTPGIREQDKLYPSSEWLAYGDIAGWPAVILFTIAICIPFTTRPMRHRFFWIIFHCMAISCFFFETSLETQFGIFIYCFLSLWWWKWLRLEHG